MGDFLLADGQKNLNKYCTDHRFDWNGKNSHWLTKIPFEFTLVPDAFVVVVVRLVAVDAT